MCVCVCVVYSMFILISLSPRNTVQYFGAIFYRLISLEGYSTLNPLTRPRSARLVLSEASYSSSSVVAAESSSRRSPASQCPKCSRRCLRAVTDPRAPPASVPAPPRNSQPRLCGGEFDTSSLLWIHKKGAPVRRGVSSQAGESLAVELWSASKQRQRGLAGL